MPERQEAQSLLRAEQQVMLKKKGEIRISPKSANFALLMYKQLTSEQRYTISILLQQGKTRKSIAETIGVSNSTITRELRRNGRSRGTYRWDWAHRQAMKRRRRSVGNRSISRATKAKAIWLLVQEEWSPVQISASLALTGTSISHETIYKIIRDDKKNRGVLYKSCRHKLKHRKRPVGAYMPISNRISIHDRPAIADGCRFGDFEMDTIIGRNNQEAILTIIERKTNMLFMEKLKHGKDSEELAKVAIKLLRPYKKYVLTITTDNGPEFAAHQRIARALETKVYFADPYASWQKGSIENANGLVRQYIPKGTSFRDYDDSFIAEVCKKLNRRPRKKHGFLTPKECFLEHLN